MNDFLKGLISTYKYSEEFEYQRLMATDSIQASYSFDNTSFYKLGLRYIEVVLDSNAKLLKSTLYVDLKFLCGNSLEKEDEYLNGFEVDKLVIISNELNFTSKIINLNRDIDFYKFDIELLDSLLYFSRYVYKKDDLNKLKLYLSNYPKNSIQLCAISNLNLSDMEFFNFLSSCKFINHLCIYMSYSKKLTYLEFLDRMNTFLSDCKLNTYRHRLFLDYDPLESNLVNLKDLSLNKEIINILCDLNNNFIDVHVVSDKLIKKLKN